MNPIPQRPPGAPFYSGPPTGHPGGPFGPPPPGPFHPPNLLPPGWTEHKAPDGMSYYYNATSGQSSWVRPTMPPPLPLPLSGAIPPPGTIPPPPGLSGYAMNQQPMYPPGVPAPAATSAPPASKDESAGKSKKSRKTKKEKAVKKTQILDSPWFIVTTNLENTFFYNKETKVSIWVPTQELEIVLTKMGQIATEKLEAERKAKEEEEQQRIRALKRPNEAIETGLDGEKRPKNEAAPAGTEMTEDDVAWQLAMMEDMAGDQDQDQHMDSQDESDEEDDEAVQARLRMLQGSGLSSSRATTTTGAPPADLDISLDNIQEREVAFLNMMRDRGVTQFDTWEKAMAKIEVDQRIYLIPNKKDRQALFDSFCVIRAQEIKDARAKAAKEEVEKADHDRRDKEKRSGDSKSTSSSSSKPEDVYRRLVEEYTTKTSTWLDFMTKYRLDSRFLSLKPGSLRESIFRQYLSDLKKGIIQPKKSRPQSSSARDKERDRSRDRSKRSSSSSRSSSRKYKATTEEIEEFMSLLKETKKDILHEHKHSSSVEWRKIKKLIDRDQRYDAVGSSTERELLFREYADRVIQRRD
ncbi:transcription elongation regulator [Mortierella sp. GBA30]|nr:transcription elongation regulator [Mortierella sp. GBA30]